ncbi:MAG: ribonuclease HIII [Mycoplasmataceae bacterium]|nr:ribonuclease HIII [Mycoplasmataceae bacterium]
MTKITDKVIGADEVGVGDYFGGIVTCAVFLDETLTKKISYLDIKDSKKLSNQKVIEIAKQLIKLVPYNAKIISPKQYNFLYDKYNNSHVIKTYAHNYAISQLKTRLNLNDAIVILDEYATKENYNKYLAILNEKNPVKIDIFEEKAERKYLCVAAASIIARYYFLIQIATLSRTYHINIPLGYNKQKIEVALNKLKIILKDEYLIKLKELVKVHFKI